MYRAVLEKSEHREEIATLKRLFTAPGTTILAESALARGLLLLPSYTSPSPSLLEGEMASRRKNQIKSVKTKAKISAFTTSTTNAAAAVHAEMNSFAYLAEVLGEGVFMPNIT